MSGSRRRVVVSHTLTTRALVSITFSLVVVGLICTLCTFPHALASPIVSDNFNDNSLDPAKWGTTLFSGFTDANVPLAEINQQLEIGPLLQTPNNGSSYRGVRTVSTYNFNGAYAFAELVKAP